MKAIEISGIRKSYFGNRVLDEVSLNLESGRFYALIGQNGSGKSTLMRILMRLEAPDLGDGVVLGHRLSEDNDRFFQDVGYASEALDYGSWLSPDELFHELKDLYPNWDERLFQKIISDLGLNLKTRYQTMSRGQRMQACMAFAFAIHPKLLLLDEVTAVLDARVRTYFMRMCKEFVSTGGTIVMATNLVSEVHAIADTLIYLESNKVKLVSPIQEISSKFIKLKKRTNSSDEIFENQECIELRLDDDDSIICLLPKMAVNSPVPTELLHPGRVTAEDIFIYYTLSAHRMSG